MFTHAQVWSAIDALAHDHAMSPSGLARKAGLDATSFNRSKRINAQGRERWPSMESIAKVLVVTGEPIEQFAKRIASPPPTADVRQQPKAMETVEDGRLAAGSHHGSNRSDATRPAASA